MRISRRADRLPPVPPPREIRLATTRGSLAGLHWPAAGGQQVLALHGWLDNAASFVPLAAHLRGLNLVALDLVGHGHSDHRPAGANYYFADYLFDVDAALDALGWDRCHLVGHSLGAAIASVFAAAAPERVISLTLLDAIGPLAATPGDMVARLRRSLDSQRHPRTHRTAYASLDAMVAARLAKSPDLDAGAARLICERAARRLGDRYQWRFDPALYWVSPVLLTEEQVLDCLAGVTAPALSITALPLARWVTAEQADRRVGAIARGTHETLAGNHHFHMDQAARTGARILEFIRDHAAPAQEPT